jgi:peptidoglycan/xylan/chitin deacetylase (PgdA/CDA1 family)
MTSLIPILMYHSVDTASTDAYRRWVVSPARFARHMAYLAEHDYRPLSMSRLASLISAGLPAPDRTVAITFDDGLRDFLTGALPVLEREAFPATLYVVTGHVGGTAEWLAPLGEGGRPMLNWMELVEIADRGVECGAHTNSHPQLDILPRALAREEIHLSKRRLEDCLRREIGSFAYPYGYASRTTRDLVRDEGFVSAVRVRHALSSSEEDVFALSRIIVTNDMDESDLGHLLMGHGVPVSPPLDRLTAGCWRLVRRVKNWGTGAPCNAKVHARS